MEDRELPNILVTGTPGVGKSTLAELLTTELSEAFSAEFTHQNVGNLVNNNKLYSQMDKQFNVPIFDDDKVCDFLEETMEKGGNVVDFHTCDFFPERWFDLVVVLRCNNTLLFDRLSARNYGQEKITENIECEIFEEVKGEAQESYDSSIILELQSESVEDCTNNVETIKQALKKLNF